MEQNFSEADSLSVSQEIPPYPFTEPEHKPFITNKGLQMSMCMTNF
jgi:hypothetical protein